MRFVDQTESYTCWDNVMEARRTGLHMQEGDSVAICHDS